MIGYLKGRVLERTPEVVLLDVGGVGYEVHIPVSTYYQLEAAGDAPVSLFVHTHLRDDGLTLYGFSTAREKQLFLRLIAVGGIGPRLAQVVLSGMPPDELVAALAAGDVARLVRLPGVGKKTAQRLVFELKDKVVDLAGDASLPAPTAAADDLVSALVNLGYKEAQAERAVAEAGREADEGSPFPVLLRLALRKLSKA